MNTLTRSTVHITRPTTFATMRTLATLHTSTRPTRFLPADSDLLDTLSIVAGADRPPMDYLSRVHGIGADVIMFLSRQGLVTMSDGRVYVTDSGLAELS
jgi:hypothetical protein